MLPQVRSCGAVEALEKRYEATDFVVTSYIPFFPVIHIIQNKEYVKEVLKANTRVGYQNHHFDVVHGHDLNVNATQAFAGTTDMRLNPM